MMIVVGSGPAGISCASALLKRGIPVTLLDAGFELETSRTNALASLSGSTTWDSQLLGHIKGKLDALEKDGPLKLSYGSDFPYRSQPKFLQLQLDGVLCRPSLAKGGLSTVWGASIMPYATEDLRTWPIHPQKLSPHYRAVLSFMGMAGYSDDLAKKFPLYTKPQPFQLSKQATRLLNKFQHNKRTLNSTGIFFGTSRLAIQFASKNKPPCTYCGLCMYGCPSQLIYSSAFTLEELKKDKNFTYTPGIIVNSVIEEGSEITILAHDSKSQEEKKFSAAKVFLACGSIHTTKILLSSLHAYDTPIILKDSQHFTIPCLTVSAVPSVQKEKLHTSCQLYLELFDKKIDKHSIHLQLYTYSDVYDAALRRQFGFAYRFLALPLRLIRNRMIVVKAYLHSDSSSHIRATLPKEKPNELRLEAVENSRVKKTIRKTAFKIFKHLFTLGFFPLFPMIKISKPGGGNHYGCSFPMQKKPKPFTSDTLGRPFGYKRLHVVDSSVLPSIASQSITLTVMANAHRIGSSVEID